jgi:hypothetical protein
MKDRLAPMGAGKNARLVPGINVFKLLRTSARALSSAFKIGRTRWPE